ncbi:hypothetical protein HMPREF9466_00931 [Fusobacterium necrophorum subsp. funduliforme 1_1_36S]|nr:hypothetical protein HMPREF9466_00931 [Fusobacterium necrophorum subsp. funduliforme 1_1_36S]
MILVTKFGKKKEERRNRKGIFYSQVTSRNWSDLQSGKYLNAELHKERIMRRISEVIAKNLSSKPVSEATWKNLVNTSSVITGPGADVIANRIPVDEREYVTKEVFFSTSVAPRISKGVRGSYTMSSFTSYDKKKDEVSEYKMSTYTVGAGTHDLGISVGLGYYFVDTYEQMQNINKSFGGSITFLGKTVGLDFMASSDSSSFYLSDFFNIRGVRMYIGQSFVPTKKKYMEVL